MDVNRGLGAGECKHAGLEEVVSADGKTVYGERCPACHAVWGRGRCDGCQRAHRRLTIATPTGERFCDPDCQETHRRRAAKEKAAEKKEQEATARKNGVPLQCEHKHTEDVFSEGGKLIAVRCLGCLRPLPPSARLGGSR